MPQKKKSQPLPLSDNSRRVLLGNGKIKLLRTTAASYKSATDKIKGKDARCYREDLMHLCANGLRRIYFILNHPIEGKQSIRRFTDAVVDNEYYSLDIFRTQFARRRLAGYVFAVAPGYWLIPFHSYENKPWEAANLASMEQMLTWPAGQLKKLLVLISKILEAIDEYPEGRHPEIQPGPFLFLDPNKGNFKAYYTEKGLCNSLKQSPKAIKRLRERIDMGGIIDASLASELVSADPAEVARMAAIKHINRAKIRGSAEKAYEKDKFVSSLVDTSHDNHYMRLSTSLRIDKMWDNYPTYAHLNNLKNVNTREFNLVMEAYKTIMDDPAAKHEIENSRRKEVVRDGVSSWVLAQDTEHTHEDALVSLADQYAPLYQEWLLENRDEATEAMNELTANPHKLTEELIGNTELNLAQKAYAYYCVIEYKDTDEEVDYLGATVQIKGGQCPVTYVPWSPTKLKLKQMQMFKAALVSANRGDLATALTEHCEWLK